MLSRSSIYILSVIFISLFYYKPTSAFGGMLGKVAKIGLSTAGSMNPAIGAVMSSPVTANLMSQGFQPPTAPMLMNQQPQPVTQQVMAPGSMGMQGFPINGPQMAPIISTNSPAQLTTAPMMLQQQPMYNPQVSMTPQYVGTPTQQISMPSMLPSYSMRNIQQPLIATQISPQSSVYAQSRQSGSYNQQHPLIPNSQSSLHTYG